MKSGNGITPATTHLLDTSAVIAYLAQEPGAERVQAIKTSAALPFIALAELSAVLWQKHGQALAEDTVQQVLAWHLPLLFPDQRSTLLAGYLNGRYRLGLGNSFVAALATTYHLTLVTKDTDFLAIPDLKLLLLGRAQSKV